MKSSPVRKPGGSRPAARPAAPAQTPAQQTPAQQADQIADEQSQDTDRRGSLVVVACIAVAVVLAGAGATVLSLQSHGPDRARGAQIADAGEPTAVSAPPATSAAAAPSPSPSLTRSASPSASPSPAPPTAKAASAPAGPSAPLPSLGLGALTVGTYTLNRTITATSSLTLTLTLITVAPGGTVTIDVSYHNSTASPLTLSCGGALDSAAVNVLTRSDGKTYKATHSYCSDNPGAAFVLAADRSAQSTSQSYAVFDGVTGQNDEFVFTWQSGQSLTGTVRGIIL